MNTCAKQLAAGKCPKRVAENSPYCHVTCGACDGTTTTTSTSRAPTQPHDPFEQYEHCTAWGDPHVTRFDGTEADEYDIGEALWFSYNGYNVINTQAKVKGFRHSMITGFRIMKDGKLIGEVICPEPACEVSSLVGVTVQDISTYRVSRLHWPTDQGPPGTFQYKLTIDGVDAFTLFFKRGYTKWIKVNPRYYLDMGVQIKGSILSSQSVKGQCVEATPAVDINVPTCPTLETCCGQFKGFLNLQCKVDFSEGCCEGGATVQCCETLRDRCEEHLCGAGRVCNQANGMCEMLPGTVPTDSFCSYTVIYDTQAEGTPLLHSDENVWKSVTDAEGCEALCDAAVSCNGYVFKRDDNACRLYTGATQLNSATGFTSGKKKAECALTPAPTAAKTERLKWTQTLTVADDISCDQIRTALKDALREILGALVDVIRIPDSYCGGSFGRRVLHSHLAVAIDLFMEGSPRQMEDTRFKLMASNFKFTLKNLLNIKLYNIDHKEDEIEDVSAPLFETCVSILGDLQSKQNELFAPGQDFTQLFAASGTLIQVFGPAGKRVVRNIKDDFQKYTRTWGMTEDMKFEHQIDDNYNVKGTFSGASKNGEYIGKLIKDEVGCWKYQEFDICAGGCAENNMLKHIGCYKDSRSKRALPYRSTKRGLSVDECATECRSVSQGVVYMAMEYQNECWCGGSSDVPDRHGNANNCLNGKGGDLTFDLYQVAEIPEEETLEDVDWCTESGRARGSAIQTIQVKTVRECQDKCQENSACVAIEKNVNGKCRLLKRAVNSYNFKAKVGSVVANKGVTKWCGRMDHVGCYAQYAGEDIFQTSMGQLKIESKKSWTLEACAKQCRKNHHFMTLNNNNGKKRMLVWRERFRNDAYGK